MTEEQLYYLVRPGTNVRALTRDDEPLIVTEEGIDAAIQSLNHIVTPKTGDLMPIRVEDYHQRWDGAKTVAKKQVQEGVYSGEDDPIGEVVEG